MGFLDDGSAVKPIDRTGVLKGWIGDAAERGYCTQCYILKMIFETNPDVWTEIDPLIFQNDRFSGMKRLSENLGIGLSDASCLFGARYWILREDKPNGFRETDEEYREGIYE